VHNRDQYLLFECSGAGEFDAAQGGYRFVEVVGSRNSLYHARYRSEVSCEWCEPVKAAFMLDEPRRLGRAAQLAQP
jgi:hypothetical protein